jgi:hypothetical protein
MPKVIYAVHMYFWMIKLGIFHSETTIHCRLYQGYFDPWTWRCGELFFTFCLIISLLSTVYCLYLRWWFFTRFVALERVGRCFNFQRYQILYCMCWSIWNCAVRRLSCSWHVIDSHNNAGMCPNSWACGMSVRGGGEGQGWAFGSSGMGDKWSYFFVVMSQAKQALYK